MHSRSSSHETNTHKHNLDIMLYLGNKVPTVMSHVRAQKKNQNARQAMVISGLSTIYRNTSASHAIKTQQQSAPRIYFLNISLDDINKIYPKICQIIEKGSAVNAGGNTRYHVKTKTEHLLITGTDIYEIGLSKLGLGLQLRTPVDGIITIKEINVNVSFADGTRTRNIDDKPRDYNIPVLIDESYYELIRDTPNETSTSATQIQPHHKYIVQTKKTIKLHATSPNSFVFVVESNSGKSDHDDVIDFYMTTEDGIIPQSDKLNNTFREDMISFLIQFKLCS